MARYKDRGRTPERPVRIEDRDRRLFEFLYALDGVASFKQIWDWIFPGVDRTQVSRRLYQLYDNRYLHRPKSRDMIPGHELVYWLDRKGYEEVAALSGEAVLNADILRARYPKSFQKFPHHLETNQVRLTVRRALENHPTLRLVKEITDLQFNRMKEDTVWYQTMRGKRDEKAVVPDWFCHLRRPHPTRPKHWENFGFLWEIDRRMHSLDRFAGDKVRAAVAYLVSPLYKRQTGMKRGRWIVVTTGKDRMNSLREAAYDAGDKGWFYFTYFDLFYKKPETIFEALIFYQATGDEPVSLLSEA